MSNPPKPPPKQQPRSFHAVHAAAAAAQPEDESMAAPLTIDDVAANAADALAQDPHVTNWTWKDAWDKYMTDHGHPEWAAESNESQWLSMMYFHRFFASANGAAAMLIGRISSSVERVAFLLPRLTKGELDAFRLYGWDSPPAVHAMVRAEYRRRATPDELAAMKELVAIDHSNVMRTLDGRFGWNGRHVPERIGAYFHAPPRVQNRSVHPIQRLRQSIDRLRGATSNIEAFARNIILTFVHDGAERQPDAAWNDALAHLSVPEMVAINRELTITRGRVEWMQPWFDMGFFYVFRTRFMASFEELRAQRATLAASLLIQRLARRDTDAANYLSSVLTRTVDPRNPRTHITGQPRAWHLEYMRRAARSKRKEQMEGKEVPAANLRPKKQKDDE